MASTRTRKQQAGRRPTSTAGRGRSTGDAGAVRRYLVALERHQPRRGRPRTPKTLEDRLTRLDAEYEQADPLRRLHLQQRRLDLEKELQELVRTRGQAPAELEDDFATAAATYGERHGITYAAWRRLGVPARVLRKAGISRTAAPPGDRDRPSG